MNKKIKYLIILLLIIFLPLNIKAKESLSLKVDKKELVSNDTVTITAYASSDKDLYAFLASLSFDENVFKVPSVENFKEQDNWSDIVYNKENKKFALLNSTGEAKSHLFMVKLFVKENPVEGTTEITLKNPTASDGNKDIEFNDVTTTLNVKNTSGKEPVVSYSQTEVKEKEITVKTDKPYIVIGAVFSILFIVCLAVVNTNDFKLRKRSLINIVLGGLLVVSLGITTIFLVKNNSKGDINQDGLKDYQDAKKINEYLIDILNEKEQDDLDNSEKSSNKEVVNTKENNKKPNNQKKEDTEIVIVIPTDNQSSNKDENINKDKDENENINQDKEEVPKKDFDTNDDGKVTITDSAHTSKDTTEKTNYKVELTKVDFNTFWEKNKDIELNFKAKITPSNAKIKEVYLNNSKVKVTLNNDIYQITTTSSNKAGVNKYIITKVVLDNGREIDIKDIEYKVDILKDEPKISDVTSLKNKLTINFKDSDKAIKNISVKIVEGQVNLEEFKNKEVVFSKNLEVNTSKEELDTNLEYGKTYTILITGSYDLDSDTNNSNYYKDKQLYFETFINGNVTISSKSDLENLYPLKGEIVEFKFDVNITPNELKDIVKKVIIDGLEYDVISKDGYYVVNLPMETTFGVKKHLISAVILNNNTKILTNYEIKYDCLKEKPTFKDFYYHEIDNKITFTLEDNDKSLENAKIVITKNNDSKVLFTKNLDLNKTNFEYKVELEKGLNYDIKILGSYDLDSKKDNKNEFNGSLFNYDLTIYDVILANYQETTYYAKKGEDIELKFKAKVTPDDKIGLVTNVLMNDEHYLPTFYGDYYGLKVTSNDVAGLSNYKITKVTLGDNKLDRELNFKIDVLKDKPEIKNFIVDESSATPIITFDLIDKDKAFKNGKVIISDGEKEVQTYLIQEGFNKIDLKMLADSLENGTTYYASIEVSYDLDSFDENLEHEYTETLIDKHILKVYKAKLTLADNNYYFGKNESKPIYIKASITDDNLKIKSFVMTDGSIVPAYIQDNLYYINLKAGQKAGLETYKIEDIIFENDVKISTPLEIKIDVLKDIPYINKVNINDNKSLSYELIDSDNALKNGTIKIYEGETLIKEEDIKSFKVDYDFKEDLTYKVNFVASYDLDSVHGMDNLYEDKELYSHTFIVGGDYNFTLSDVTITDAIKKNEQVKISFTSTNTRGAIVQKVTLNNKEYDVTNLNDNKYEVIVTDANTTFGEHEITFDKVKLDTLKEYSNKKDFDISTLKYTILKDSPSVSNIKLTNNSNNKTINVKFNFKDDNNSLIGLKVILVSSSDKIIASHDISNEEIYYKEGLDLSYDKNTEGKYTVKFIADYKLGDKYQFNNQNIGEQEITINNSEIYIAEITLKKDKYVSKNLKNYEISYDVYVGESIKTNNNKTYTRLSIITVNGTNYIPNGESTNKPRIYKGKIGITTPSEAGIYTLTANRVQLELNTYYDKQNNYYSVPDKAIQIEVLKDIPKIENLEVTKEDYLNGTMTIEFDVIDKDLSFIDGGVYLDNLYAKIEKGHNIVKFKDIKKDTNLDLIFKASYDLDSDIFKEEKDLNEYHDIEIYKTIYGLYDNSKYNDIEITNAIALSKNNDSYFNKNEQVKVDFNVQGNLDNLELEKVIIKDRKYNVIKSDNKYEFDYSSYNTFGEKEIVIDSIILTNGKVVKLAKPSKIKLEVLKDKPRITDYKYEVVGDKIKITSKLKDSDAATIDKVHVKITNDREEVIIDSNYQEELEFAKGKAVRYYVKITSNYDLDTDTKDNKNYYQETLLDEIISLDTNNIELKDINDINLYKIDNQEIKLIDKVSKSELDKNKANYFVEINMDNMPSIRTKIKEVKEENGILVLVLDYQYVTLENSNLSYLKVEFGELKDGSAVNEIHPAEAIRTLIQKLKNNEDVTLTRNYDASSINDEDITYVDTYSKTLDGNGFTIKNLKKPLFKTIDGATIKNLTLSDVTMPSNNGNGVIAIEANNSNISKVIVENYYKPNAESRVGVFFGSANNTTIKESAALNFNIYAGWDNLQQIGGLVGYGNTLTIENCYANGKIPGGWNFRGGLVGNANNVTFLNNYAKVEINYGMGDNLVFDFAAGNNNIFKNNLSLTTGFSHRFTGLKESLNNYYVDDSDNVDVNLDGITRIKSSSVTKELFTKLDFSDTIWNLDNPSLTNLPIFKYQTLVEFNKVENDKFDENKIVLYNNLKKLMPFYKTDKIIELASSVKDSNLNTKEITHIIPVDNKGSIVNYLTSDNLKRISKIKIVYKTLEHQEYNVLYDNTYDMVASYHIPSLNLDYNFNHYVIDSKSQLVQDLTNYLQSLKYTENLDILTNTSDSRIYKDFYNEVTSKELKEFTLKYLSNSNYTNTTNDNLINDYLLKTVKKDKHIEKTLYMYNYLRRFYDLDIDGMKLYDFMLFNMEGFDKSLTSDKITSLYFDKDDNFRTDITGSTYASVLGSYTNKDTIAKFIEYMVTEFGDGNLDRWTKMQFKGYLVEIPVKGMEDKIQYTLWDHFSNEDANYKPHRAYDMMLPILTLPKNAAYIISTPVQYVIGAERSYIENPDNFKEFDILKRRIKSYADRMADYYETAYKILEDPKLFNDIHTFHLDKRYAYDENGAMVYQQVGTNEPFHKNFNELLNRWQTSDGNAAVAWGDRIDWSAEGLMDGYIDKELAKELGKEVQEYTYHTFTHESAHNIDARLFLKNNGRRFDAGGEDYADSNLMQSFGPNDIVMNLSVHYDKGTRVGSNLDPSRIDTPAKVWDYYDKVFETIYVMDYLEAQAFLQLSNEDKAEIGIQVSYPNEDKYKDVELSKYRARQTTGYSQIDAKAWEEMNLKTINDLIDNKIMKYAGVYKYASRGSNSYGGEGINTAHWYQPNNPDGRPDSYALKWIAYEMLGYKGYQDGYIEYNSNIHSIKQKINNDVDDLSKGTSDANFKSDSMALYTITKGKYTNFDDYKKARFMETADKLPYLKKIKVNDYVQKLYDALVEDARSTRVDLADKMQKEPNCLDNYWCRVDVVNRRSYPNSTKVRQEIYYTLKDLTNDFQDEIFADTIQQEVKDFKVNK